jgi:hypothetical protein
MTPPAPDAAAVAEDILARFTRTDNGWSARVGQVQIRKWREQLDQAAKELVAAGAGPLLDPDCRDGKCGSCVGAPCEHSCHDEITSIAGYQLDEAPGRGAADLAP